MTCPELSHFRSVTIHKIHHMQISHVSEDDGIFLDPLSARASVLKGLKGTVREDGVVKID